MRSSLRLRADEEGWAAIDVEDTGPGIAADDLAHVFERFYRGGQEAGHVPGTGIGLALAKECVELHQGEIFAENRPAGGTRFTVRLRVTSTPAEPVPDHVDGGEATPAMTIGEARTEEPGDTGRPKVLVVDDHADMRAYLHKHLVQHYEVIEAARGDAGLEKVRAEIPDVIVCDVMMPGLDGYQFCRAIESSPDTDFLPVILLTAKGGAEGRLEGLEGGADDYVTKPFDPAELLARIRNLLLSRERLKARFATAPGERATPMAPSALESADSVLLTRLREVLERESSNESFDVPALAGSLGMSRAQLHRRLKEVVEATPAETIIRFRLERAAQMLALRAGNVGEVAYAVGFKNLSHFVRRFRERYGQTPAAYAAPPYRPATCCPPVSY